jgi:hypothetical protein
LRGAREPPRRRRGGLDRGYDPVAVTSEEEFFKLAREGIQKEQERMPRFEELN